MSQNAEGLEKISIRKLFHYKYEGWKSLLSGDMEKKPAVILRLKGHSRLIYLTKMLAYVSNMINEQNLLIAINAKSI